MTDTKKKPRIPYSKAVHTAGKLFFSPRLRLVAVGSVILLFVVAVLLVLPDEEPTQPLTSADIEQIARRLVTEQTESLRDTLNALTERVAPLSKKISGQDDELAVLQNQLADLETDVTVLKSVDMTHALETTKESWQAEQNALVGRMDAVETQLKNHAKDKTKIKLRKAKAAAPYFHVAAIEHWGDTSYVTLSVGGSLALLREGETRQGWQFIGIDTDSGEAIFANGKQTRKLRVGR